MAGGESANVELARAIDDARDAVHAVVNDVRGKARTVTTDAESAGDRAEAKRLTGDT